MNFIISIYAEDLKFASVYLKRLFHNMYILIFLIIFQLNGSFELDCALIRYLATSIRLIFSRLVNNFLSA
jgi:hypothetical protein